MKNFYSYNLTIEKHTSEILRVIDKSKVTLIKGPTGCGKSTYVPLILDKNKRIAIIEPRRIAVTSLYNTLSKVIHYVGYKMRFNKKISDSTNMMIYTDGTFLNDDINKEWDYIIVDEVHERSVRIDLILNLIKNKNCKIILMSATVDTDKIQKYFNAGVYEIQGQSFPCKIIYSESPVSDYIIESCNIIKNIINNKEITNNNSTGIVNRDEDMELSWLYEKCDRRKKTEKEKKENKSVAVQKYSEKGIKDHNKIKEKNNQINVIKNQNNNSNCTDNKDILVFLTGEEDINDLEQLLKKFLSIKIYKIYSNLNDDDQNKIYEKCDLRKVILSTNICETSLTIPGIKYVIDCGLVKTKVYDGINYFGIVPISKESSDQRLGRCNRTGPGVCYRLYTNDFRLNSLIPEIKLADLSKPILQLISKNINIFKFDFLDYPTQLNVKRALNFLIIKKLITENLKITKLGLQILSYPFELNLSCFYQNCIDNDLGYYGSILVSLISLDNYNFLTSNQKEDICEKNDKGFNTNFDHPYNLEHNINKENKLKNSITDIKYLIELFIGFVESKNKQSYCKNKQVSIKNLDKAHRIFKLLNKNKKGNVELLEKIFSKSFEYNLSVKQTDGGYKHLETGNVVFIHPSSLFFKKNEKKIVFVDVLCTTKEYVRIVGKYFV